MTEAEFREWFSYYKARFTGIEKWLTEATQGSEAPTRKSVLAGWFKTLRNVDLKAALTATDQLHSGEIPEPKGFYRHPAVIRAASVAKKIGGEYYAAPKVVDGEYAYRCRECEDSGTIWIWHRVAVEAMKAGTFSDPKNIVKAVAACSCRAGDSWRRHLDTFNAERHCRAIVGTKTEEEDHLRRWCEGYKPPNRERSFDDFDGKSRAAGPSDIAHASETQNEMQF